VGLAQAVGSSGARGNRADLARPREAKKELIEKQCFGLVEFVAPSHDLDTVVAPVAVKERLEQDVRFFKDRRHEALPMGYLFCGVIGTGKTFTATCLAGSFAIPTIVFKNLRSKWVGSSEGNLQKVLSVIKALGPVVVVIVELQRLVAIRESTDPEFIPERLRELYGAPFGDDQSTALERRIQEISALLR